MQRNPARCEFHRCGVDLPAYRGCERRARTPGRCSKAPRSILGCSTFFDFTLDRFSNDLLLFLTNRSRIPSRSFEIRFSLRLGPKPHSNACRGPNARDRAAQEERNSHDRLVSMNEPHASPQSIQHPDWKREHAALLSLKKSQAALDLEFGERLLEALRSGAHRALGFASFAEYVERILGEKPRWTRERLRVAEALEGLPLTRRELGKGELHWSAVRELTRVATAATEAEWIEAAQGRTARQLEELAGRGPGDRPGDPANPELRRHVLHFEVSGEVLATFREAAAKLRRDADGPLSEEEALLLMARQVLAGPSDAGKSSYQLAVTVCERCGRGFQQGAGELVEVSRDFVDNVRREPGASDVESVLRRGLAMLPVQTARAKPARDGASQAPQP